METAHDYLFGEVKAIIANKRSNNIKNLTDLFADTLRQNRLTSLTSNDF